MKYARIERERRFLLRRLPDGIDPHRRFRRITDIYIPNTRLRLRRVESDDGLKKEWKLTQKYRDGDSPPFQTVITNIYLSEAEYETLARLGGAILRKRRYQMDHDGRRFAIDVFEGELEGIILAEVEGATDDEIENLSVPPFAVQDVTGVEFFTGGRLACATREEVQRELRERLVW